MKIILLILSIILLTVVSQVGGIILLLNIPLFILINRKVENKILKKTLKPTGFIVTYLIISLLLVPLLAKLNHRVPLTRMDNVKSLSAITFLLNRHYVTPELKTAVQENANLFCQKHPGSTVCYMDACFPFTIFSMLPHLSHKDGKKLDLAFFYTNKNSGKEIHKKAYSPIGYGGFEHPLPNEYNMPEVCENQGNWQYSFMEKIIPQYRKKKMQLDATRTRSLIEIFALDNRTQYIFIEPHIKTRLFLSGYPKIVFHGCQSVRHDDHIHLQNN